MEVLFTRGSSPLSRAIRYLTGEPVSHCAILCEGMVIHMNLLGLQLETEQEFQGHAEVVYRVEVPYVSPMNTLWKHWHTHYDFGGLLYLGLRCILPILPKANLWQTTGMEMCTEFVTDSTEGVENHTITPYQLYLKLGGLHE